MEQEKKFTDMFKDRAQTSILWIYDCETGEKKEVTRFDHVIEAPNWSKDGKALYYNSLGLINRLDLDTLVSEQVDTGKAIACNNDHVLAADGSGIAISSNDNGGFDSNIFIVRFSDHSVTKVIDKPLSFLHGWSPDGKKIAYCAARMCGTPDLEWDVYIADADGSNETRLTETYGLNDGPEFSPDGKQIWFNSVRTGRMQAWRMNADGSEQTQMTFDKTMNSWFPHISPDGTRVVYIAYHQEDLKAGDHVPDKNVEIRMIPATGGEEKTLVKFFGGQGSMNVNSWAPDSRRFAFVSYEA